MQATITTSAQTLIAATSGAPASIGNTKGIQLRAPSTNTAIIYFGRANTVAASGALTKGLSIEPGQPLFIRPDYVGDANLLYLIAASGSQELLWEVV